MCAFYFQFLLVVYTFFVLFLFYSILCNQVADTQTYRKILETNKTKYVWNEWWYAHEINQKKCVVLENVAVKETFKTTKSHGPGASYQLMHVVVVRFYAHIAQIRQQAERDRHCKNEKGKCGYESWYRRRESFHVSKFVHGMRFCRRFQCGRIIVSATVEKPNCNSYTAAAVMGIRVCSTLNRMQATDIKIKRTNRRNKRSCFGFSMSSSSLNCKRVFFTCMCFSFDMFSVVVALLFVRTEFN